MPCTLPVLLVLTVFMFINAEIWQVAYTVDPPGFLVGITENIPLDRWQHSCGAIMDGLERHARERSNRYNAESC